MIHDPLSPASEESVALRAAQILFRRRTLAFVAFATVMASAVSFAVYLPDLYQASALVLVERQVSEALVKPGAERRAGEPAADHQAGDPQSSEADRAHRTLQPLPAAASARGPGSGPRSEPAGHSGRPDRSRAGQRTDQDRRIQAQLHRRGSRNRRGRHQRDRRLLRGAERPHAVRGSDANRGVSEGAADRSEEAARAS